MRENALLDFFNPIIISQGRKIVKGTIGENGEARGLRDVFWGFAPNPTKNLRFLDFPLRCRKAAAEEKYI